MKLSLVLSSWRSSRLSFGEQALPFPRLPSLRLSLLSHRADCSPFFPPRCSYSLDVSDWMINGDYIPTRLAAQHDAGTGSHSLPRRLATLAVQLTSTSTSTSTIRYAPYQLDLWCASSFETEKARLACCCMAAEGINAHNIHLHTHSSHQCYAVPITTITG